jgi:hypothetical protein
VAALKGRTQPRLWTPPLRTLNRRTSLGYDLGDFAEAIGEPLLPWQKWLAVHALELNRDGSPRFKTVLILVARQSGKTSLVRTAILHRLYVVGARLVLGVAADVSLARENWQGCVASIHASPWLATGLQAVRYANGDETIKVATSDLTYADTPGDESLTLAGGSRYKIAAANRRAGRGLSVDFLHIDEVREWPSWEPWAALQPTTAARPDSMIWLTTNAGDSRSVVLNSLRESALSGRSDSIGLFEWSAEPGSALDDVKAWQAANPGLGYTISERALRSAYDAMPASRFRTEYLCQFVDQLDSAVDLAAWRECADPAAGSMAALRPRGLVCCFDISPDSAHAALAVAARLPDGRARVELAAVWTSPQAARDELAHLLDRIKPAVTCWYPAGPGGQFATILRQRPGSTELTGTRVSEVCMELASLVTARRVLHGGEDALDQQVTACRKLPSSDGWRFGRKGEAPVDAAYAAAGAISAALILPEPKYARVRFIDMG